MTKQSKVKRIIASLLLLVMLFTIAPPQHIAFAEDGGNEALGGVSGEYITMPITFYDFANDGLLFEYSENYYSTGTYKEHTSARFNPTYVSTAGTKTYALPTGAEEELRYNNRVNDFRYIVLTYTTSRNNGVSPDDITITLTETDPTKTHTATYVSQTGNYNNYVALYAVPAATTTSGVIDSITVNGDVTVKKIECFDGYDEYAAKLRISDTVRVNGVTVAKRNGNSTENYTIYTTHTHNRNFGFTTCSDPSRCYSDEDGKKMNELLEKNGAKFYDSAAAITLPGGATMNLLAGEIRAGLVQGKLGEDKELLYQSYTVDYMVYMLQSALWAPMKNNAGVMELAHVMGTKTFDGEYDLATAIRNQLGGSSTAAASKVGTYADSADKKPTKVEDISTYYDAAYFLLHNLFSTSKGYGQKVNEFRGLVLKKTGTDGNGRPVYEFNSEYGTAYGSGNANNDYGYAHHIYNTNTTANPNQEFNPLGGLGYGKTISKYEDWQNTTTAGYDDYNYLFTMEGHAQFIYNVEDELYFEFDGDDDVYLYINGVLVLDLGGTHKKSDGRVSINDVAEKCGLVDGQAYDFDFYYMERHTTEINFKIETNIQMENPSMETEKIAYQHGTQVGYAGFINHKEALSYAFQLTNSGNIALKNLEFHDATIGVSLTPTSITGIAATKAAVAGKEEGNLSNYEELRMVHYYKDGTYKYYAPGEVTETKIKEMLTQGLEPGEQILIQGFKYKIPDDEWKAISEGHLTTRNYFDNTLNTFAYDGKDRLHGTYTHRVQKPDIVLPEEDYYAWGKLNTETPNRWDLSEIYPVTISNAELLRQVKEAHERDTEHSADHITSLTKVQIVSASGLVGYGNNKAKVQEEFVEGVQNGYQVVYTPSEVGVDSFYVMVTDNNGMTHEPMHLTVYTYGVADNTYVLDYNLSVNLNDPNHGLTRNDELVLAYNDQKMNISFRMVGQGAYGTFDAGAGSIDPTLVPLTYTMQKFLNSVETVEVIIQIQEKAASDARQAITAVNGVEMTQKLTIAPASVMHYENDFTDITYLDSASGNKWQESTGTEGTEQDLNQNSPYGSDTHYKDDQNWVVGIGGTASNGTIHQIVLTPGTGNSELVNFTFKGTGMELISRATQENFAAVVVRIKDADGNLVKMVPVITESKGGDVYEVPIVKVDNLPYGTYTVTVSSANTGGGDREIYVDGIRIYNPLGDNTAYYNAAEQDAKFLELRPQILKDPAKVVFVQITDFGSITLGTGSTMVERQEGTGNKFVITSDKTDYLKLGPNNEVYLDGAGGAQMLAFYVKKSDISDGTIQVGVHRKYNGGTVKFVYGGSTGNFTTVNISSGTEQYITIDPAKLSFDDKNRALVLIGTTSDSTTAENTLVLTNLKLKNYTLENYGAEVTTAAENGTLNNTVLMKRVMALRTQVAPIVITEMPKNAEVYLGEKYTVTVKAQGNGLKYQWYIRNAGSDKFAKSSVTGSVYSDVLTKARVDREVYCVITDASGNKVTTDTVKLLRAKKELTIVSQPVSSKAYLGDNFFVEVKADGEGLKYQWYLRNAGSTNFAKSSVTGPVYSNVLTKARTDRELYCVITDAYGNKVTTDTVMLLRENRTLEILTQPTDSEVRLGETYTVSVVANGDGLKYRWYIRSKGETEFKKSSVTGAVYSDVLTKARVDREVYCVITDEHGNTVTTDTVTLKRKMNTATIVTQPTNSEVRLGETYSVKVEATGDGLKYQWYLRNAGSDKFAKSSVTDAEYTDVLTKARVDREIYCVITDEYGNKVTTDTVKLLQLK